MDIQAQLFETALGIEEPMFIEKIDFDQTAGELHIHINFRRGGKFTCSKCGKEHCRVHDTTEKIWRHLNFFQYKCYIHFRTPNTKCDNCGVHLFVPPCGRPQSGFTVLFEAFIMTLAKEMPVSSIANLVNEHDTRLWRIIRYYIKKEYDKKDLSNLTNLGVDETSSRKGHKYVTIFVDMTKKEVVYATSGKDETTISRFAKELSKHNGNVSNISEISIDMSPAFIFGARKTFPNASVTFDKFHVIQHLNEALDEVRRNETKLNPCLKGSRYLWLKNPSSLSLNQQKDLKTLSKENRKLAKAYQMKLTFQDIYKNIYDVSVADIAVKKWLSWAVRSRIEPIKRFAKMVKSHYVGILQYFNSRLTAGLTESINSRIQYIKRRARGFRNIDNFIAMIYLETANLPINILA